MPIMKVLQGRVPVKVWTNDVEPEAERQLINTAALPFVFRHVAVMPDVHFGIGATVGSVVATKGAVVPAAVGVDIGCFTGDTKVPLLNGTMKTMKELIAFKNSFYVYSIDDKKNIVAGVARAKKTRLKQQLIDVTISGGEVICCTPDHKFLLRSGEYKEASLLKTDDSLMPFYRSYHTREGYEAIYNPDGNAAMTHKQIYKQNHGPVPKGYVVHHDDHNRNNNAPDNLKLMTFSKHSAHHRATDGSVFSRPDFIKNRKAKLDKNGYFSPELLPKKQKIARQNILRYMKERPDHFKKAVSGNGKRGAKFLTAYNISDKGRAKSKELANKKHQCGICSQKVNSYIGLHNHLKWEHNNHKVVSVRLSNRVEDVYCLQVSTYHNFALAAGVFVHNCGMIAVELKDTPLDNLGDLAKLRHSIERSIPVGFEGNRTTTPEVEAWPGWAKWDALSHRHDKGKAICQLGSLGGGNHFIEICGDLNGIAWVVLHSGSRGIGNKLAQGHIESAKGIMKRMFIELPDPDLAYFAIGTPEAAAYMRDLLWAQDYALENREEMMRRVLDQVSRHLGLDRVTTGMKVNCHHNFAVWEHHFGENVLVTRKGAVRAQAGDMGIIPGSMGTRSYIVRGLGNPESFNSCSHGAGRRMSRSKARKQFTREDLAAQTLGVECRKDADVIDEIPGAYKPIEEVMANQSDLVEVVAELKQILCIKG